MTLELDRQLTEYAEILDQAIPDLDPSDVLAAVATQAVSPRIEPIAILRRRPLLTAAATVLVVLLVIGGTSLLFLGDGSIEPADTPQETVVVTTQPPHAEPPPVTTQPQLEEAEVDAADPSSPLADPLVGKPAPSFDGDLVGGGTFSLSDHAGRRLVVLFWAPWCTPCNSELESVQFLVGANAGIDGAIGAIISQQDEVATAVTAMDISLPVIDLFTRDLTNGYYIGDVWGPSYLYPMTVFIDESGNVAAVQKGAGGMLRLQEILDALGW